MTEFSRLHQFSEITEIRALVRTFGWDMCYTQLAPGKLELEAYETRIGDCLLYRERFGCPILGHGTSTPDAFNVLVVQRGSGRVFGMELLPDRAESLEEMLNRMIERGTVYTSQHPGQERKYRLFPSVVGWAETPFWAGKETERTRKLGPLWVKYRKEAFGAPPLVGISKDIPMPEAQDSGFGELAEAVEYIQTHYGKRLKIESLARKCGLSVYQFERRMKRVFLLTAGQFIIKTRIQTACELLRSTSTSIVDIALKCGFSDQSAFTRQFKVTTGMTPTQYREGLKG